MKWYTPWQYFHRMNQIRKLKLELAQLKAQNETLKQNYEEIKAKYNRLIEQRKDL